MLFSIDHSSSVFLIFLFQAYAVKPFLSPLLRGQLALLSGLPDVDDRQQNQHRHKQQGGDGAGWLAGAAALATAYGAGPDLVYLPEVDFDMDKFLADVDRIYKEKGNCMVAVSEGIHYADGTFVSEAKTSATDGFGHAQLGGLAAHLASVVKEKTGAKVRGIELSLLQRCGAHLASETDIEESVMSGKAAVENAVAGITDKMVGFQCTRDNGKYVCKTELLNLTDVANTEKKVPLEWINKEHNGVEQPFIDYVLPLIQGEPNLPKVDSLPRFAKLKKVLVK